MGIKSICSECKLERFVPPDKEICMSCMLIQKKKDEIEKFKQRSLEEYNRKHKICPKTY